LASSPTFLPKLEDMCWNGWIGEDKNPLQKLEDLDYRKLCPRFGVLANLFTELEDLIWLSRKRIIIHLKTKVGLARTPTN